VTGDTPLVSRDTPLEIRDTPLEIRDTPLAIRDTPLAIRDTPLAIRMTPLAIRVMLLAIRMTLLAIRVMLLAIRVTRRSLPVAPVALSRPIHCHCHIFYECEMIDVQGVAGKTDRPPEDHAIHVDTRLTFMACSAPPRTAGKSGPMFFDN
jgi:hypothetical protein